MVMMTSTSSFTMNKRQKIAEKDRYSIIVPNLNRCMVCGTTERVCIHEVFFGSSNRVKSINDGLCVPLCFPHHQGTYGVHNNKALDTKLKKQAEKMWIKTYCDPELSSEEKIEAFIKRFNINVLDEDELD